MAKLVTSLHSLVAEDCYILGKYAYYSQDFYHTYLWMQAALGRELLEQNKTVARSEILDYCAYATSRQGNIRHALSLTKEWLLLDPNHERAKNNKLYYERMILDEERREGKRGDEEIPIKNERQVDDYRKSVEFTSYEALCRGEDIMAIKDEHRLKCRFETNNHPLLMIRPVKLEEVHLKPWIVLYHDFLSDAEIETIKTIALPRLNRATVNNVVTGQLETASYRVSKSAWLQSQEHIHIDRVVNRIEAATGLNMETAEELQVANYGLGGHYEPHFDFSRREEEGAFKSLGTGNRLATMLNYMSDVEAGGATVFPRIGVKLFPKKGVSAFWYNLYRNGQGIEKTRHAACPVLVGTKWVSTKWIHELGQEFRRKCSLNPDE
ncbi:prolyl 4-hydroxylase subunit alpha-1-like [Gigantopelta aegis]|uniref:prolyl 4-hydroxylase subunit alpha-1-like n=1 Tax=Gigantopelta aegis TaxID=1735272 RepID=UPI001B887937|nr:prolyl 4-hydroxylase subunit alpha-1-like [Gigantopelta aegis]